MYVSLFRYQRFIAAVTIFVMIMAGVSLQPAGAVSVEQNPALQAKANLQQQMEQCFGADVQPSQNTQTGKVNFAGVGASNVLRQADAGMISASAVDVARGYLADCGSLFGLSGQANELSLLSKKSIPDERSVVRFQQSYQGIPVFGAQMLVQLTAQNSVILVNGDALPIVKLNTQASVAAGTAEQTALQVTSETQKVAVDSLKSSTPQLMVYSPAIFQEKAAAPALVWRMEITPRELAPIRELVLIDAHTGAVVFDINQVDTVLNRLTYTTGNTTTSPGTLVCDESDPDCSAGTTAGNTDAVAAHLYAGDTYNFYFDHHGRDSIDNAGMDLISTVHYSLEYCNAFWNGAQMTYGDGCDSSIVVDDVVAHEMTHGVTDYESGLVYFKQQGAINESLSDIWGEFVDLTNTSGNDDPSVKWQMGEDITGDGPFRNMKDPTVYDDPDRMGSYLYYNGTGDNGGVHWNSGVGNKAAYLITDGTAAEPGGAFNGESITGLGIDKAAAIYYEAQTNILTPTSNYRNLRDALNTACATLTGGALGISATNCAQVNKATLATEMDLVPVPAPAPTNDLISSPITISATSKVYSNTQDIINATTSLDDPDFPDYPGVPGSNSVWYKFTPALSRYLTINTIGSDFDSFITVFTGTPGSLVVKKYNDDINYEQGNMQSAVRFYASSGVTYYIELGGWWGSAQNLVLNLSLSPIITSEFLKSDGAKDGWVLESTENSNLGGTMSATSTLFNLGDAAADKQYRAILSFNTSVLGTSAKITKATLKIKRPATSYLVGNNNPFTWGQGLKADVCKNIFGSSSSLQTTDFNYFNITYCVKAVGTFGSTPDAYWYSAPISSAGLAKINTSGLTQFRLYFTKDDNDDLGADYMMFYSGSAGASSPRLVLEYYYP